MNTGRNLGDALPSSSFVDSWNEEQKDRKKDMRRKGVALGVSAQVQGIDLVKRFPSLWTTQHKFLPITTRTYTSTVNATRHNLVPTSNVPVPQKRSAQKALSMDEQRALIENISKRLGIKEVSIAAVQSFK